MFINILLYLLALISFSDHTAITELLPKKPMENSSKDVKGVLQVNNLTVNTEGGITMLSTPPVRLNQTDLISLDNEFAKAKTADSSRSKVVARKGVNQKSNVTTTDDKTHAVKNSTDSATKLPSNNTITATVSQSSTKEYNKTLSNSTTTPTPKKPLTVSVEAIDKMEIKNKDLSLLLQSSTKSDFDQIAPLNKNNPNKKVLALSSTRHPGMVMPIVITILVVPMFAVLGYMGLKRGQEAWKNRHYKRMDFLLDGMYNE